MKDQLPPDVLKRPVNGRNLNGATFGEALGDDPTLVCFLRHFG
jgi:hypothetical protein